MASAAANGKHGHTLISDAKFRRLFELALQFAGDKNSNGSAAALAGIALDLRGDDAVIADGRARIAWINAQAAQQPAASDFRERVVAAMSGAAGDRLRRNGRLTVIICEEPPSGSLLPEAHQLADAAKLPVLFVENGPRVESAGSTKKRSARLPQRIGAMPVIPVDAQDVIAIYRVAHESITRAREGGGPTRIQCVTWSAANGPLANAVDHLEQWLERRGLPAHAWRREIEAGPDDSQHRAENDETAGTAEKIQELRSA